MADILLEVAIASVEDARAAQAGGADRVELNAALACGGLTPSLGTLLEVKKSTTLPVVAMLRPRGAGFAYSDADFRVMQRDADLFLEHGADALAFGVLREDGGVDVPRCRLLVQQIGGRRAVFHRAFDVTPEPFAALEQLIDLGITRLMTSGQEATALQGSGLIAELQRRAAGRIEVLPAAGIRPHNIVDLLARTGCRQVHASLRHTRVDPSTSAHPQVAFGGPANGSYEATDPAAVAELKALLRFRVESSCS